MDKKNFTRFIEDNILSLFTGSVIGGEESSTARDAEVAQGEGGAILVKYNKTDDYRLIIKRIQPFKSFEISLVKSIIEELKQISFLSISNDYIKRFHDCAIEKAVCKAVSEEASSTLLELITKLSGWGQRTYEGKPTTFGFLISGTKAPKGINKNLHVSHFLSNDFSAVISDGINTAIKLSVDGYLTGSTTIPKTNNQEILSPFASMSMTKICKGEIIGLSLLYNGDILILSEQELLFAKRAGVWTSYSHDEIIHLLADRKESTVEIRKAIYLSCLDLSFTKNGGCVVHLTKDGEDGILKHIDLFDILDEGCFNKKIQQMGVISFFDDANEISHISFEDFIKDEKCTKICALAKIVNGRKFYELDRRLRQEMLSIDGATIIDNGGNVIAVGAIVKIDAGSSGGGRLAATKTLSQYGVATKISADGSIQCFHQDKNKVVKPLFYIR